MKLYLVQHGEAKTKDQDPDRSLTNKGRENSEKTACFASEQAHISVETVLHSNKARSKETAEIMAAYLLPPKGIIQKEDLSPNDNPKVWADSLSQEQEDLMVVGHLPHLPRLASLLLLSDSGRDIVAFTPGTVVCLEKSGGWQIKWMISPQVLKPGGEKNSY